MASHTPGNHEPPNWRARPRTQTRSPTGFQVELQNSSQYSRFDMEDSYFLEIGSAFLKERKPSKLDVAGSSPVPRSALEVEARQWSNRHRLMVSVGTTASLPPRSCAIPPTNPATDRRSDRAAPPHPVPVRASWRSRRWWLGGSRRSRIIAPPCATCWRARAPPSPPAPPSSRVRCRP